MLRIGTRGSKLAIWQADFVKQLISEKFPQLETDITVIKTTGDRDLLSPLSVIGGKGVFVKEIEEALLSEGIDIAVHSMKDVPTVLPEGLILGSFLKRHDPRDALLTNSGLGIGDLPPGTRVGTGSLRRGSQLLHFYPELEIIDIRGNVDTRIRKLRESKDYDAIILAMAGLERMGLTDEVAEVLSPEISVPAPGQGIITIECRESDASTKDIISEISHGPTCVAADTERAYLIRLSGDCNVPVGCFAEVGEESVTVTGTVISPDGKTLIRETMTEPLDDPRGLGERLAEKVLANGGDKILDEITGL